MGSLSARAAIVLFILCVADAETPPGQNSLLNLSATIRDLTARVSPAVVQIKVTAYGQVDTEDGRTSSVVSRQRASASGVIVDPAGYIITNAHVVLHAISIDVFLGAQGISGTRNRPTKLSRTLSARIVAVDRKTDLAVIRVNAENLPALSFGDSDELRQGDLVFAIGSPVGLRNSVSMGVVSAPARAVSDDDPVLYIQTDASINPGNSGGALVDSTGSLIGLNTFILSQSGGNEGIGFAIPSNVVRNVFVQLRDKGRVSRGTVGIFVQNITTPMARGLRLRSNTGVIVGDVDPDGPGEAAGIKRGDVILTLNGKAMETAREFENAIYQRTPGEKTIIIVQRGSSTLQLVTDVKEQSSPWDPLATIVSPEKNLIPRLGILCIEIDKKVAEMFPELRRQYGLIVAAKSGDGQAQFTDLQQGDVIHAVNGVPVAFLAPFRKIIDAFDEGDAVVLQVERDGRFQYIAFNIE